METIAIQTTAALTTQSAIEPAPMAWPEKRLSPYREPIWYWIAAPLLVIVGMGGLRLANDSWLWSQIIGGTGPSVTAGELIREKGGVRLKQDGTVVWYDVPSTSQRVAQGDTVFTDSEGLARLQLLGGNELKILPNSLIVVQSIVPPHSEGSWFTRLIRPFVGVSTPKTQIGLKSGSVKLELKEGAKPLELEINHKSYQLATTQTDGIVDLMVDPNNPEAPVKIKAVTTNPFMLSEMNGDQAKIQEIAAGQIAVMNAQGTPKVSRQIYKAISPQDGENFVASSDGVRSAAIPVRIRWDWVEKTGRGGKIRFELKGPEDKTLELTTKDRQAALTLPEGDYKWRVSVFEGFEWVETSWTTFHLSSVFSPQVIGPVDGFIASAHGKAKAAIPLSWKAIPAGMQSEVEVQLDRSSGNREKVAVAGRIEGTELELPSGKFVWHVRARDKQHSANSGWSSWRRLAVDSGDVAPLVAAATAIKEEAPRGPTPLEGAWKKQEETESGIPIRALPPLVARTSSPAISHGAGGSKTGADASSRPVTARAPKPGTLQLLPVSELSAAAAAKAGQTVADGQIAVLLQWGAVPNATEYGVKILQPGGAVAKEDTVKDTKYGYAVNPATASGYQYQVTTKLADGQTVTSPLTPIRVEITPPSLREPAEGSSQTLGSDVVMTWAPTSYTQEYRIQIAKDSHYGEMVADDRSSKNLKSFTVKDPATYFWRVKSLSHGNQSSWSDTRFFIVK